MDGRLPSTRWSPTIPRTRMVTQYPRDDHLQALGWSTIIQNHIPKYCCPASQGWSPMIPSMVTHHPKLLKSNKTQQLQLNKEFDTSAAQLVFNFFMTQCFFVFIHHSFQILIFNKSQSLQAQTYHKSFQFHLNIIYKTNIPSKKYIFILQATRRRELFFEGTPPVENPQRNISLSRWQ